MDSVRLHFQRLPAEAQRATLWRLALSGLTPAQVSARTGCPVEQIRQVISEMSEVRGETGSTPRRYARPRARPSALRSPEGFAAR